MSNASMLVTWVTNETTSFLAATMPCFTTHRQKTPCWLLEGLKTSRIYLWMDLTLLNMGSHSERYKNAGRVARQVVARYGSEGTSTTGHSLGGAVAVHVNRETGLKNTAFNPLSSLGGKVSGAIERVFCNTVGAATARCKNARNSTVFKVGTDPVAMRYRGADQEVVRVRQKTKNPHSLDNF
jgi:hypothetical protein